MSHFISLDEAKKMTAEYRAKKKGLLAPEYKGKNVLPICESFERSAIEALLKNPECKGIRIYYGLKNEDEVHAILVGYDGNDRDILPTSATERSSEQPEIVDNAYRCPTVCPPPSDLNG